MTKPPDTMLVVVSFADESVAVLAFVTTEYDPSGEVRWSRLATREAVDAEIARMVEAWEQSPEFDDRLPVKRWKFVEPGEIPKDRTYRDAWRHDDQEGFGCDMPRAREVHRNLLRLARRLPLAQLDIDYQRADEAGDGNAKREIARKKQALRDSPINPAIDAAKTVQELRDAWPREFPAIGEMFGNGNGEAG